jgi:phosphoglycolate phosphatase
MVHRPPLLESFAKLVPHAAPDHHHHLLALYRERFAHIGMFENTVYPGIPELLATLKGRSMFVATSKPHIYARRIIEHFGLHPHFIRVHGSELDGKNTDKSQLIAHVLASEGIKAQDSLMIGDRMHDIIGASKNGLLSIGVSWGYGSEDELISAGADHLSKSPEELSRLLS